jgi:membrane fusion protein, multidrug efflux system
MAMALIRYQATAAVFLLLGGGVELHATEPLSVAAAEYRDVDTTYSTEAVVEAVRQSTISAQVMGRIVDLRVDVGDFVKAGQVVARIDEREAAQVVASSQAQVAQARANLQNARLNLERARRLLENNFVSQSAVDHADAEYKAAEAQLKAAEAGAGQAAVSKGYTTVVAPISGVVSARNVEVGEMATPGKPLLTTFDPNDMRVIAEVPQSMVPEIRALSRASVEVPSVGKWIKVKSMVIIPAADPRTHSTRVRLYLAGDERDIYPGVYAQAHFAVGHAKKLVIPAQSVIRRSEVSGVYVVNEKGATSFRQIRLGEKTGEGLVEVLAGVSAGEKVALEPVKAGMVGPVSKPAGS